MRMNGPIFFLADNANKNEWAYYFLSQILPMSLNGPNGFLAGNANRFK